LYGVPTGACCCSSVTCARAADGAAAMASVFASMAKGHDFLNMEVSSVALTVELAGWTGCE
jgi:hypothetical protein